MRFIQSIKERIELAQSIITASLMSKDKRGFSAGKSVVASLIGALIVIVMINGLGSTMFDGLGNYTDAPTWLVTIMPVIVAAGLIYAIWKMF